MPTKDWNAKKWGAEYRWPDDGHEWSKHWGGTSALWWHVIFPRIQAFLPAQTILEIASGHGRLTPLLRQCSERMIGVDLNQSCIDVCRNRFSDLGIEWQVNDGRTLPMIEKSSVDFVFSWDSLVHCDMDVVGSYLAELSRILTEDGVAFIHHSNLGSYPTQLIAANYTLKLPVYRLGKWLRYHFAVATCWRAEDVTAESFRDACLVRGLSCISQELINWENRPARLIDCLSLVCRPGSRHAREFRRVANGDWMRSAENVRRLSSIYHIR